MDRGERVWGSWTRIEKGQKGQMLVDIFVDVVICQTVLKTETKPK